MTIGFLLPDKNSCYFCYKKFIPRFCKICEKKDFGLCPSCHKKEKGHKKELKKYV